MNRYADPQRCPDCLAPMQYGADRCPRCGLSLTGPLAARLFAALSEADAILQQLRTAPPPAATSAGLPPAAAVPPPTGQRPASVGPEERVRHGLSAATVPQILLGLGAVCLLVAALVFLAVTWPVMGVAGRTATLVGFTVVAGGLAAWLAGRGLRAAAESLSVVALGLLTFDLFGARDSGWFGDIGVPSFLVLVGCVLLGSGAAASVAVRRTAVPALTGAEVVAALGLGTAAAGGLQTDWLASSPSLALSVALAGAVALGAHGLRLLALTVGAAAVAALLWVGLLGAAWARAVTHATGRELWLELEVWPLLAAVLLAGAPALIGRLPVPARVASLAVAETVLVAALLAAFTDEPLTLATAAGVGAVLLTGAATWFAPAPWSRAACVPLVLGAAWMGGVVLTLGLEALDRMLTTGLAAPWTGVVGAALDPRLAGSAGLASWLLPVTGAALVAALLVLARALPEVDTVVGRLVRPVLGAAVTAATVVGTVALYPAPVWLVLALCLLFAVGFSGRAARRKAWLSLAAGAGFLTLGVVVGLHAEGLTLAAAVAGLGVAGVLYLGWTSAGVAAAGGVLLAGFTGLAVWTVGALTDGAGSWTAAGGILAVAILALALPYVDRLDQTDAATGPVPWPRHLARAGTELGALTAALVLALSGLETVPADRAATWAAVYLTVTGAAVSTMALLRPDRRPCGWLGAALLAAASWVRLWDIGVETPEAYTLPSALALTVVGLVTLRRHRGTSTMAALSPALGLGLVPSLLWVVWDPIALRSVLVGLACLALVVGGVRLRWTAPVVYGATAGLLLVLRHSTPLTEAVPRWVLIGTAGALLIGMGITWERRLHEARALVGYMRALR